METFVEAKARLRAEALARRDALTLPERIEASLAIADHAQFLLDILPGTIVSGFLPIRSEVDPRPLMMALSDRGARLCVPAMVSGELEFRELLRDAPLEPQGFGTYAPGAEAPVLDPELMLIPFAAFDVQGGRIGYGRGYYDRAIARLHAMGRLPRLVGIGFSVQEVERAPMAAHDVPLQAILTEKGAVSAPCAAPA